MTTQPTLPASCHLCVYFSPTSTCQRHAPSPGLEQYEITHWPLVRSEDRCGSGAAVTDGTGPGVVRCQTCVHWWQPGDKPVEPDYKQGRSDEFWKGAGLCTRYAPSPSGEEERRVFWKVTNRLDGCGDGQAVATAADQPHAPPLPAAPHLNGHLDD